MTIGKNDKFFNRLSFVTLIAVYFLILVGGIVRSTGSGMGCPDWPKCFGEWVPPTNVAQLPDNYKEIYSNYRHQKNIRFSRYLEALGMTRQAKEILNDQSIREASDFNAYKTWTEYINRLVGSTIGILIFATMVTSIRYIGKNTKIFALALATFILVGFQGWIGSVVVSTNLMPWIITVHMILALLIVLLLIYIYFMTRSTQSFEGEPTSIKRMRYLLLVCLVLMITQILLGTQVRQAVDEIAASLSYTFRDTWVSKVGLPLLIHRSFSLLVLAAHVALIFYIMKDIPKNHKIKKLGLALAILIFIEIISGAIMAYSGIPPFIQPLHLLLGTAIFGILFYLYLLSGKASRSFELAQ